MRNYLTFDNKDSRDFGVYINGQGTFRAPARSYNVLNIPGRNGDLLGFGSKLENVEITYRAFIYTNFDANIAALRSFLLSHVGYFKLTDSYHPDEYRLAYYKGPFVPDVVANNGAGSFDLTFVCKPQRFLNSGEEVTTLTPAGAEHHTYQGEIVNFSTLAGDKITSALADFHPIQDLHGYATPWPAGGGKNKLPSANSISSPSSLTVTNENGQYVLNGSVANGDSIYFRHDTITIENGFVFACGNSFVNAIIYFLNGTTQVDYFSLSPVNRVINTSQMSTMYGKPFNTTRIRFSENQTFTNAIFSPMVVIDGADTTTFAPYSNICPISGRTGLSVYVGPTTSQADATTYAVDWTSEAGTVYGGTLNVVTGLLTVNKVIVDLGTLLWNDESTSVTGKYRFSASLPDSAVNSDTTVGVTSLCSQYVALANAGTFYATNNGYTINGSKIYIYDASHATDNGTTFQTAMSGVQLCYELATPLTYQLTPQEIEALADNYMWSDVGQVTVTVTDAMTIENPTLFDAKPLLRVYGAGTLTLGGQTITISTADVYTDIDCEMMDCFKDTVSKNGNVSFSGYDFPVIPPGRNVITMDGVTQVDITPRWWAA